MKNRSTEVNDHLDKVKKFHDWDAEQYRTLRYHDESCEGLSYVTRKDLVLKSINNRHRKVLDIGCGPGILTRELLNKDRKVFSADLSTEMVFQAKEGVAANPLSENAYFAVCDVSDICFSDKVIDLALCIGVVCYIPDYHSLISEIHRVLKTDGETIIQINKIRWPTLYKKFVPLYHYIKSKLSSKSYAELNFSFNYFTYQSFIETFKTKGFSITNLFYFDFRIPFIDIILPRISLKLGKIMFKYRHSMFLRCFAHGLLIKARKI